MAMLGRGAPNSEEEIELAIEEIEKLNAHELDEPVFRYMNAGFKWLLKTLERKQSEPYELLLKFLRLYLKIQSNLMPDDDLQRQQFENNVPNVTTYIIGCLQRKPKNVPNYHYQLLEMLNHLLANVKTSTIEKFVQFETGIIACLWFPIDIVGDFNTQMLAFRLLVMILKCVDSSRQQNELNRIRCGQVNALKEKLNNAIIVGNHHVGKFENIARELLNNYNMNVAENVLVYSFRCRTLTFGSNIAFFKTQSAEHFWIDLNYCPRTLTFTGRFKPNDKTQFINVTVTLSVCKMMLSKQTLKVYFMAPAKFSKNIYKNHKDIETINYMELQLSLDEFLRLKENHFVVEYYNSKANEAFSQTNHKLNNNDNENLSTISSCTEDIISDNDDAHNGTIFCNNEQQSPLNQAALKDTTNTTKTSNEAHNIFEKSYNILIGDTSTKTTSMESPFKLPSLPQYDKMLRAVKKAATKRKMPKRTCNRPLLLDTATHPEMSSMSAETAVESPITSRQSANNSVTVKKKPELNHPIRELREKRRFFKTPVASLSSDSESTPTNKSGKQKNLWKRRNVNQQRKSKLNKEIAAAAASPQRKQVNKVKPLNCITPKNAIIDVEETNNRAQAASNDGGIINITHFLNNGNESRANFNAALQRTVLEQVVPHISEQRNAYSNHANVNNLTPINDDSDEENVPPLELPAQSFTNIYEDRDVSDAEPGQSYRNFRVRSARNAASKVQTAHATELPTTSRAAAVAAKNAKISSKKNSRKRPNSGMETTMHIFNKENTAIAAVSTAKQPKIAKKLENKRQIYSADIEIDLTRSPAQPMMMVVQNKRAALNRNAKQNFYKHTLNGRTNFSSSPSDTDSDFDALKQVDTGQPNGNKTSVSMQHQANDDDLSDLEMQECRRDVQENSTPLASTPLRGSNIRAILNSFSSPEIINVSKKPAYIAEFNKQQNAADATQNIISATSKMQAAASQANNSHSNSSQPNEVEIVNNENENIVTNAIDNGDKNNDDDGIGPLMSSYNQSIVYRRHSESDESAISDFEFDSHEYDGVGAEQTKAPSAIDKIAIENMATTTTKTTITKSQFNSNETAAAAIATATATTTTSTRKTTILSRRSRLISQDVRVNNRTTTRTTSTTGARIDMADIVLQNDSGSSSLSRNGESLAMIASHKNNLNSTMCNLVKNAKTKCLDIFISKLIDVGESILSETEKQQKELQEMEEDIGHIVQQLDVMNETFEQKSQQFRCFKENMLQIIQTLSASNIKAEIAAEYDKIHDDLQQSSHKTRSEKWQNYIRESIDNFVKNCSHLSDI